MKTNEEMREEFERLFPEAILQYRPATDSWCYKSEPISATELVRLVAHTTLISNNRIQNLLTVVAFEKRRAAYVEMREWVERLETPPPDSEQFGRDAELRIWLRTMQHPETSDLAAEANVVAMKQWIWLVKRHALRMEVVWQVAPIFWSVENGTGKSFNLKRLIEPFKTFTRYINVNELGEKFSGRMFSQTLVACLDEFAGVEKANVAQLKAILTGSPIDKRTMHSEAGFYAENRLSCIATSNLRPPHGFIDTSGARRFWSIQCSPVQIDTDPERAKEFDMMDIDAIWRCVSVHEKAPQTTCEGVISQYMKEVRQDQLRSKTSLESFCGDEIEHASGTRMAFKEFQSAYKAYCHRTHQSVFKGDNSMYKDALESLHFRVVKPSNKYFILDSKIIDDVSDAEK